MTLQVVEVPLDYIHTVWPHVEPLMAESVKYSTNTLTVEETKVRVADGSWTLIVAMNEDNVIRGAATVSFYNRTDNRIAYVTNIAGRMLANMQTFSQFCDILKQHGATCIEGTVRDSLMRLWERLGARKQSNLIQISL